MNRAARLLDLLQEHRWSVATAESLTGGLLAAAITDVPGASRSFRGGVVAYATPTKSGLLGVPEDLLAARGPVCAPVAEAMARGAAHLLGADLGIATTGVAGPEPVGGIPPGVAFVAAVAGSGGPVIRRLQVPGDRAQVRRACVAAALQAALAVLGDPADGECSGGQPGCG